MSLSGKRALITGASSALGSAIAQRLARDFPAIAGKPLVRVYPGGGILPIRAWPLDSYTTLCYSGYRRPAR